MKIFIYLLLVTLFCQRGLGKKGKAAFREAFGRVAELRSCLESGTPLLALTATANKEMRKILLGALGGYQIFRFSWARILGGRLLEAGRSLNFHYF